MKGGELPSDSAIDPGTFLPDFHQFFLAWNAVNLAPGRGLFLWVVPTGKNSGRFEASFGMG